MQFYLILTLYVVNTTIIPILQIRNLKSIACPIIYLKVVGLVENPGVHVCGTRCVTEAGLWTLRSYEIKD